MAFMLCLVLLNLASLVQSRAVPSCPDNFCQHEGTCVGDNICICAPSFTGPDCTQRICTSTFCHNGGTCVEVLNEVHCRCPSSTSGPQCQFNDHIVIPDLDIMEPQMSVGAPPDVRTVATSPSAIAVTWNRAPTQGTHVSYYEVIYFKKEHQFAYNWLKNVRMSGSTPHTAQFPSEVSTLVTYETLTCLSGLSDSTTFVLAVRAHAGNLIGQFSGAVEVATLQSSAGQLERPTGLSATVLSSTEIRVSWSDVNTNQSRVSSYEIRYIPLDHRQGDMGMEMMMTSPTNSVVLSSLGKDTRYTIRVRVVGVNMAETSEYSTGVLARTSEDVPGPVQDVVVTPALRAIQLNWSTPLLSNGILLSYEVSYSLNGEVITANTSSLARWLMIGSLSPLTTLYDVSVSAYTSVGRGEAVVLHGVDTFFPTAINATYETLSATSVLVSWTIPNNTPEATTWSVYYRLINSSMSNERSVNVSGSMDSVRIRNLEANREYVFQVVAFLTADGTVYVGERVTATFFEGSESSSLPAGLSGIIVGSILAFVVVVSLLTTLILAFTFKKNNPSHRSNSITPTSFPEVTPTKYNDPVIKGFPDDTTVLAGDKVLFSVIVCGEPEPNIAWYHNGKKIKPENAVLIHPYHCLSIPRVELYHSGVYRLYANNSAGTAMSQFTMTVQLPPDELPVV